jgi:beta-glucosidase
MGWEKYPEGFYYLLKDLDKRYGNIPIMITENGIAIDDVPENGSVNDADRIEYLETHLDSMLKAYSEGVNMIGYFAWSFMDNFEWAEGYSKRFGLIYIDYKTLERIPKKSAYWYSDFIKKKS